MYCGVDNLCRNKIKTIAQNLTVEKLAYYCNVCLPRLYCLKVEYDVCVWEFPLWLSRLRIWSCHCSIGHSCGSDSITGQELPYATEKKKKKNAGNSCRGAVVNESN